jgi:hypothetical protein
MCGLLMCGRLETRGTMFGVDILLVDVDGDAVDEYIGLYSVKWLCNASLTCNDGRCS